MTDKLDAIPGSTGRKIIDGLKDAVAGNFASVTIEGQRWVRADAPGPWSRDSLAQIIASDGLKARASYVQGFTYEPSNGEPYHVIRDVWREPGAQELFRTNDREQYEHRIQIEKAAIIGDAILAACPSRSAASTVEPVAKLDPVTDWVGARLRSAAEKALAAAAAPTTSPEPDSMRKQIADILADEVNVSEGTLAAAGGIAMIDFGKAIDLLAALSRPAHGGWEDISTAPKDGTPVLVGFAGNFHSMHAHYEDGVWGHLDSDFGFEHLPTQPTHWMPLPAPPIPRNHGQGGGPRS